jgi:hypothetical protein
MSERVSAVARSFFARAVIARWYANPRTRGRHVSSGHYRSMQRGEPPHAGKTHDPGRTAVNASIPTSLSFVLLSK